MHYHASGHPGMLHHAMVTAHGLDTPYHTAPPGVKGCDRIVIETPHPRRLSLGKGGCLIFRIGGGTLSRTVATAPPTIAPGAYDTIRHSGAD